MARESPMAAKTAKARKMDMLEMRYIQSRGDAADYKRGRYMPAYSLDGCRRTKKQEEWAYAHILTPMEQWAIKHGYMDNPFKDRPKRQTIHSKYKSAVYYKDGRRRIFSTSDAAYKEFENNAQVVKVWDGDKGRYTLKTQTEVNEK